MTADLDYFKSTYAESKFEFEKKVLDLKSKYPTLEKHTFRYKAGETDFFYLSANQNPRNLLIIISGTHGVEGYAGSAVQRWALDHIFTKPMDQTGLIMIHGLNSYGFQNDRRVNENNVDLNRNFLVGGAPETKDYADLNSFLNPTSEVELNILSRVIFLFHSAKYILQSSLNALRNAVVGGQYSFPQGIFYGGTEKQAQEQLFQHILKNYVALYEKVFILDLHTGYGQKGKLHLLAGVEQESNSKVLKDIFKKTPIDFASHKDFYKVNGDVISYLAERSINGYKKSANGICFEYGTLDSQKVLGSLESLRRIVLENQNFWHPNTNATTDVKVKQLFREMFYPSSHEWRQSVINQSYLPFQELQAYLEKN